METLELIQEKLVARNVATQKMLVTSVCVGFSGSETYFITKMH